MRRPAASGAIATVLLALVIWRCGGTGDDGPGGSGASSAASSGSGGEPTPDVDVCERCSDQSPTALGELPPALVEISGLAPSRVHEGMFWAHNDSGDVPRLFLLKADGTLEVELTLEGAGAVDYEDLAVGPCDAGSCIYVGDIGDNNAVRNDYVIYRVAEPTELSELSGASLTAEAFPFAYPDGSHDAEALFWAEGALHVITKQLTTSSQVFRLPPLSTDGDLVAEELLSELLPPEGILAVTGADADERGILLRTYTSLFFYPTLDLGVGEALSAPPCVLPVASEQQGEAVAWRRDALGYVTASEGQGQRLYQSSCP